MTQLQAMTLSIALEVPVVLALCGLSLRATMAGAAATLLTHPIIWWAFYALQPHLGWTARAALLEGAVVLVEAAVYRWTLDLSPRKALGVSALANTVSFGVGLLLQTVT